MDGWIIQIVGLYSYYNDIRIELYTCKNVLPIIDKNVVTYFGIYRIYLIE